MAKAKLSWVIFAMLLEHVRSGFPEVIPSVGEIWPQPQFAEYRNNSLMLDPQSFRFAVTGYDCDILQEALTRYLEIISRHPLILKGSRGSHIQGTEEHKDTIQEVQVHLERRCEMYPHQDMDERYEISISSSGDLSIIKSESVWGILHGLESFTQLLVPDGSIYNVKSIVLEDFPRFSYRGIMIDTGRHYLTPRVIREMLDLMAMNKFNILHWHMVDDQSFPYQSLKFPKLSQMSSYSPLHVYTKYDIADIIEYARLRGIRVIPEFDTPDHTQSWGPGQPGLLTPCYEEGKPDGKYGPIDPSNDASYEFLTSLMDEVAEYFPDGHIHLGGDTVLFKCWKNNPFITEFMAREGIQGEYKKLEALFFQRLVDIVSCLPSKDGILLWEDLFYNGVNIPDNAMVHVWVMRYGDLWKQSLEKITMAGHKTILSACWYLSEATKTWRMFYDCDPHDINGTIAQKELILGGEACLWGERIDSTNLITQAWPNACAVSEKLWSSSDLTSDTEAAVPRLEEHRCRMVGRGHRVSPLWPSYCPADVFV